MRPLELRLRNFRSFRGEGHTFDFRERRLIGVVGPIGSGKSTILDAIAFALYGCTPRINRETRSLIHQQADHAAAALRFEVDGEVWEAVRNLRRSGQSQHALYKLSADEPDAGEIEKVLQQREVNARVQELLGLDFPGFSRSVLLAQGRFAEFLNARPAERDKVLKGVFGYERIGAIRDLARRAAGAGRHEIEKLDIRLENARAAEERLSKRREELAAAVGRLAELEKVRPAFDELAERIRAASEKRRKAEGQMAEFRRRAKGLPNKTKAERSLKKAGKVRALRSGAERKLAAAEQEAAEAKEAAEAERVEEREQSWNEANILVVRLEDSQKAAVEASAAAAKAAAEAAEGEKSVEAARSKLASAEAGFAVEEASAQEAEADLSRAEKLLHDARRADMAGSLREHLAEGDDCPVCEQPVPRVPPVAAGAGAAAEEAAKRARSAQKRSAARLRTATGAREAAKAALEGKEQRLDGLRRRVEAAREVEAERSALLDRSRREMDRLLGEGDPAALLEAERTALDAFHSRAAEARRVQEAAQKRFNKAAGEEKQAQRAVADLRIRIAALAALLPAGPEVSEDDPEAVRAALTALHADWKRVTSDLKQEAAEARTEAEADAARLAGLRAEHGVEGSIEEASAAAGAKREQLETYIEQDEKLLAGAKELAAEKKARRAEVRLHERLVKDLTDARFVRFLLDEERAALAGLGSEHFERLSSGRYRFTEDGEFSVVDLNAAEAVRRADSLSGGETFLASLGLALGLAEMVGRRGGRLDAFFLDEGFGALDPEHLDLAMEGIESLVSAREQRLVVVVSHVPEVQRRIEDLIELGNDPATGDSKVVSGGAGQPQPS